MKRNYTDEGIVIRKRSLKDKNLLVTIFSKKLGKITLSAYGVKKITSRRISHLETGNYIRFSYYRKDSYFTLRETELIYGYSKIRVSETKLDVLFMLFFILNKILPEEQEEYKVYIKTLDILKNLNNTDLKIKDIEAYLKDVLSVSGFIDQKRVIDPSFDVIKFTEDLIGQEIKVSS